MTRSHRQPDAGTASAKTGETRATRKSKKDKGKVKRPVEAASDLNTTDTPDLWDVPVVQDLPVQEPDAETPDASPITPESAPQATAPQKITGEKPDVSPDIAMDVSPDAQPEAAPATAPTTKTGQTGPLPPVRFIHAADLHLDAVFSGISRDMPQETARRLHQATFTALEHLFALCERVRPDFLLLAGDIYNQEDRSLAAQLAVRDGCARLERLGVQIFIVHGNHDPLSSRLRTLQWSENVTVFGEQVGAHTLYRDDAPLAVIHGASHSGPKETRNLAAGFTRTAEHCLQVGLLHTSLGDADGNNRYAPCTVDDFRTANLDYWALGHIHDRRTVCDRPLAQYPGSTQGLHVNEPGPHGCLVVSAQPEGDGYAFSSVFQPLGPVEWHKLDLDLGEEATIDSLEQQARAALAEVTTRSMSARGKGPYLVIPPSALVVRLRLTGRTGLDAELRRPGVMADLLERLRDEAPGEPLIWLKDIEVDTRPLLDRSLLVEREDLLGEILRMADRLREDPERMAEMAEAALSDLYGHARARKALDLPTKEELLTLLANAETACLDLLENE